MWVEIAGRKNLGTNGAPKLGVRLLRDGSEYTPEDGTILRTPLGRWRARIKPEYGPWIELVCLDVATGPSGDLLEVEDD